MLLTPEYELLGGFNNPWGMPSCFLGGNLQGTSMLFQSGGVTNFFLPSHLQQSNWGSTSAQPFAIPTRLNQTYDETEEESSVDDQEDETEVTKPEIGLFRGEKRLVIQFESFGRLAGPNGYPQTCCRVQKCFIPHGLCGTHKIYGESWRFRITHTTDSFQDNNSFCVCLMWEISNLSTGKVTKHKESRREASLRMKRGNTVSSRLFRAALETHAEHLEKQIGLLMEKKDSSNSILQLKRRIQALRPRKFSEGTLVFGLQHLIVQKKLRMETE